MKKILLLILILAAAAALAVSCTTGGAGTDTALPSDSSSLTENPGAEPGAATGLTGWFDYGTALYLRNEFTAGGMTDGISFQMAKNEKEGFQYILTASEDVSGLRCEVTPLSDGAGHTLTGEVNVVWYLWVQNADAVHLHGFTPCMMLPIDDPYQGGTFDVAANTARTLYVRYDTTKDTVPGTYTGKLEIRKDGATLLSGDVSVRVRDVYYDEKTECITVFGLGYDPGDQNPALVPGPDSAPELMGGTELERIYAQFMLDNRLNTGSIPYPDGLLSEGAVEYVKNPRVTMVGMPGRSMDKQYAAAVENGILDKFVYGTFDEPHEIEHLGMILQAAKTYRKIYPGLQAMDCLMTDLTWEGRNIIETLSDTTNVFSPKLQLFLYDQGIRDSIRKYQRERDATVVWYVCGDGDGDIHTACFLPCVPGTDKRVLFWQQYQEDIDGVLYWRVTFWNTSRATKYTVDVWADDYLTAKRKFPKSDEGPTDDGVLLYWHPETGMPVSTLGFEAIRDGVEDFQLLKMAEAAVGREKILSYVERISTDPTEYVHYENGSTPLLDGLKNQLFDLLDP